MWGYRLDPADGIGVTMLATSVRTNIQAHHGLAPGQFDRDLEQAEQMARALGWDGTMVDPIRCFTVPGPDSFMIGFVIVQATSNQRFCISPVPLAYMDDVIRWDARTSTEEVKRAIAALKDGKLPDRPQPRVGEWRRSRKGNYYTTINGSTVTIFPDTRDGGYKVIVSAPGTDRKIFTHAFPSELEAMQYVVRKFYDIVKEWGTATVTDPDDPFAGVDWSNDIPF